MCVLSSENHRRNAAFSCSSSMPVTIRPSNTRPDSPGPRNENHKFSLPGSRDRGADTRTKPGLRQNRISCWEVGSVFAERSLFPSTRGASRSHLRSLPRFRMRGEFEDNSYWLLWAFNEENIVTRSSIVMTMRFCYIYVKKSSFASQMNSTPLIWWRYMHRKI